jgi:gamma-glutamyltranspeptidase/glutathione hydrolase
LGLADELVGAPSVPRTGPLSVAVPGLVGAWIEATRHTTRSLSDLLAPAIAFASDGFAVYRRLARAIAAIDDATDVSPALAALVRSNGRAEGETFRQTDLARSLASIAEHPGAFYSGALAGQIAAHASARGGRLAPRDLAEHASPWTEPLWSRYRGRDIATHPLVSLGCVLLEELRILEGFDLASLAPDDGELVALEVAASEAAAEDADARLGDPSAVTARAEDLLSDERAEWWRERIAAGARARPAVAMGSDTTSIVVADGDGSCACVLQSLFNEWGSRELVGGTGILLNDRLANLRVGGATPNRVRPGKRPLHTLHAYVVLSDDELVLAGGTPGGRGQAQTNMQVIVNVLDHKDDAQTAIDRPRWLRGLPRRGEDRTVYLENGFPPDVAVALRAAGHPVEEAPPGNLEAFGNCTVIARDPVNGALAAGADRRRGGHAVAW